MCAALQVDLGRSQSQSLFASHHLRSTKVNLRTEEEEEEEKVRMIDHFLGKTFLKPQCDFSDVVNHGFFCSSGPLQQTRVSSLVQNRIRST